MKMDLKDRTIISMFAVDPDASQDTIAKKSTLRVQFEPSGSLT